jgi:hypothetical protein
VSAAPDYIQPISGWRTWLVAEVDGKPRLASVFYYALWPVRRQLVSECLARRSRFRLLNRRADVESHATPAERCTCGIYAGRELRTALGYLHTRGLRDVREVEGRPVLHRVLGRVALWGGVIDCDAGWRGAFAYPQSLFLPERTRSGDPVRRLEDVALSLTDYGVPVQILDGAGTEEEITEALREQPAAA